jgi:hypothetical protein
MRRDALVALDAVRHGLAPAPEDPADAVAPADEPA